MLKTARITWKPIFNKNNLYDAHLMCFSILYKSVSKPCNDINWSLCHTPDINTPKVIFICQKCCKLRYLLNCKGNFFRNGKKPKIIWAWKVLWGIYYQSTNPNFYVISYFKQNFHFFRKMSFFSIYQGKTYVMFQVSL